MSDVAALAFALAVWAAGLVAVAGVSGSARTAKYARVLGLLSLLSPLLCPAELLVWRALLTGFGVLAFGRALDLARRAGPLGFWGRVWMQVALFDVREAIRRAPSFDGREATWLLIHFLGFRAAWLVVFRLAPSLDGAPGWLLRWSAGLIACYALVEVVHSTLLLAYRGLGVELPRVHVFPILSMSLAEFWGRRWNRVVSTWLNDNLFFPLARRRMPVLGICAAFAGSTAMHFWFAWAPLDLSAGLMMSSFFMVHGAAMLIERLLQVPSWSQANRRIWTAAWIVLPSPLFIEPTLRILAGFVTLTA